MQGSIQDTEYDHKNKFMDSGWDSVKQESFRTKEQDTNEDTDTLGTWMTNKHRGFRRVSPVA